MTIPSAAMIWLDLDDTLIDFTANSRSALTRLWHTGRLDRRFATPELWYDTYERHNMALWGLYNNDLITRDYLRHERFYRPLIEGGYSPAEAEKMTRRFDTLYLDYLAMEKQTVPGALGLLRRIHDAGIPAGILSNGFSEVQYRKMDAAGITPWIALTVLSDDIGINKPDPRIFRHAVERAASCLGVSAGSSGHLMIGDNPATDIAGALSAGWQAIWFDRFDRGETSAPPCAVRVTALDSIEL